MNTNKTQTEQLTQDAVMHSNLSLSEKIDLGLAKIMFLGNQINRKTKMCCFVNDVAHCEYLEIKLLPTKQKYNDVPVAFEVKYATSGKYDFYVDSKDRLDNIERCISVLEEVLKKEQINYDLFHAVKKYVVDFYEI